MKIILSVFISCFLISSAAYALSESEELIIKNKCIKDEVSQFVTIRERQRGEMLDLEDELDRLDLIEVKNNEILKRIDEIEEKLWAIGNSEMYLDEILLGEGYGSQQGWDSAVINVDSAKTSKEMINALKEFRKFRANGYDKISNLGEYIVWVPDFIAKHRTTFDNNKCVQYWLDQIDCIDAITVSEVLSQGLIDSSTSIKDAESCELGTR